MIKMQKYLITIKQLHVLAAAYPANLLLPMPYPGICIYQCFCKCASSSSLGELCGLFAQCLV